MRCTLVTLLSAPLEPQEQVLVSGPQEPERLLVPVLLPASGLVAVSLLLAPVLAAV